MSDSENKKVYVTGGSDMKEIETIEKLGHEITCKCMECDSHSGHDQKKVNSGLHPVHYKKQVIFKKKLSKKDYDPDWEPKPDNEYYGNTEYTLTAKTVVPFLGKGLDKLWHDTLENTGMQLDDYILDGALDLWMEHDEVRGRNVFHHLFPCDQDLDEEEENLWGDVINYAKKIRWGIH